MIRKLIANGIGGLGIACSLAFWVWIYIFAHMPFQQRGVWMKFDLGVSSIWPALWVLGFLLSLAAAAIGSWRWILAAILPLFSCAAAILVVAHLHL